MADGTAPILTTDTVNGLIARLSGQLDAVERSAATADAKKKARDEIVPLMSTLHDVSNRVDALDLGDWVNVLAKRFRAVADIVETILAVPDNQKGGCHYRRSDTGALVCVPLNKDDCDGLGQFDPNGCPP